jgi:mono/diheme cytochrome c family protein
MNPPELLDVDEAPGAPHRPAPWRWLCSSIDAMTSRSLGSLLLLAALSAACGGDDGGSAGTRVYPPSIWTGGETEGTFQYKVPIVVTDSGATFSIEAIGFSVTDLGGGEAELTTTLPGEATLSVVTAERTIEVPVKANLYQAGERAAGLAVYNQFSCGSCHDDTDDNTSSAIAEHPDEALMLNVRMGHDPDGDVVRDEHNFNVPDNTVVAYLRSLPAKGKPGPDL